MYDHPRSRWSLAIVYSREKEENDSPESFRLYMEMVRVSASFHPLLLSLLEPAVLSFPVCVSLDIADTAGIVMLNFSTPRATRQFFLLVGTPFALCLRENRVSQSGIYEKCALSTVSRSRDSGQVRAAEDGHVGDSSFIRSRVKNSRFTCIIIGLGSILKYSYGQLKIAVHICNDVTNAKHVDYFAIIC